MRAILIVLGLAGVAAAAPPRWSKLPADKYRCSRYAPGRGDDLHVYAPPAKPMIFTFAAAGAARYRAEGLPPGASVTEKGHFEWQIPGDAKGSWTITLVAESAAGERATSAFALSIAEPDLVAAWRAGMGSFEPDCQHRIAGYEFRDLDGDGKTDLMFVDGDEKDDSANGGSYIAHVHLRTAGGGFDTVDRQLENGTIDTITTPDGVPALAISNSCCCMASLQIVRLTKTGVDKVFEAAGEDCRGYTPIELAYDAKQRLVTVTARSGDPATERVYVWRKGTFELR